MRTGTPWIARACGLLLVVGGLGISTPASATTTAPVKIATLNVHSALSMDQALSDISRLASTGADVISLQEMGGRKRRDYVRAMLVDCDTCELDAYMPIGGPEASIPILYRQDRFIVEAEGSHKVSEATYVGPKGAGPSTLKAKFVNYVVLYDLQTKQRVAVLNNHAVPTVQAPYGGPNSLKARHALYRKHMDGLTAKISEYAATGATVFATGDFNVNYRKDSQVRAGLFPYSRLRAVNTHASYEAMGQPATGTHVLRSGFDRRLIDYVFHRTHPAVNLTSQAILRGYASDHRPLLTQYDVGVTEASAPPVPLYPDLPDEPTDPAEPPAPVVAPGAPTAVTATRGNKQATVSWTAPEGEDNQITGYTVTASPDGTTVPVSAAATSALVTGLTNGRHYTFTVVAANAAGESPASEASAVTIPATTPKRVHRPAVKVMKRRARITWSAPPRTGGTPTLGYRVMVNSRVLTTAASPRRIVLRNVKRGVYRVRVQAVNELGSSPTSKVKRFRIRARGGTWSAR